MAANYEEAWTYSEHIIFQTSADLQKRTFPVWTAHFSGMIYLYRLQNIKMFFKLILAPFPVLLLH